MTFNPFETLGLPTRPDLDDEQVRAAWRAIAAATHPDRDRRRRPRLVRPSQRSLRPAQLPLGPLGGLRRPDRGPKRRHHPPAVLHPRPRPRPAHLPAAAAAPLAHRPRPAAAPGHPRRRDRAAVPSRAVADPRPARRPRRRGRPDRVLRADRPLRPGTPAPQLTVRGVGAWCRAARFFTHLPGAGPSPGKPGGPGRTHKGRARTARPSRTSVRPPGHARPRTSQDTGQTTARRSRRNYRSTAERIPAGNESSQSCRKRKTARKYRTVIHPEWLTGRALSAIILMRMKGRAE